VIGTPTVKANGIEVGYFERGSGRPLLLIMGLGAPGGLWERHLEGYAGRFRCIVPDNRGAGSSSKPKGDYDTATMAQDAVAVMDGLGIGEFGVCGISMGGAIAQRIAASWPDRVRGCVLTASWAYCDEYMKGVFRMLTLTRAALGAEDFARMFALWLYSGRTYAETPWVIDDHVKGGAEDPDPMPAHAFEAQAAACVGHDMRGGLGGIKSPTLITAGDADIFTPIRCSEYLHGQIKGSRLEVFEGLAHTHHWEDIARYNGLTAEFLGGC